MNLTKYKFPLLSSLPWLAISVKMFLDEWRLRGTTTTASAGFAALPVSHSRLGAILPPLGGWLIFVLANRLVLRVSGAEIDDGRWDRRVGVMDAWYLAAFALASVLYGIFTLGLEVVLFALS